jgi:hypothetical protein
MTGHVYLAGRLLPDCPRVPCAPLPVTSRLSPPTQAVLCAGEFPPCSKHGFTEPLGLGRSASSCMHAAAAHSQYGASFAALAATPPPLTESPPLDAEPDAKACQLAQDDAKDDSDWKPAAASAVLVPEGSCRKRRRKNASAEDVRRARRCDRSAPCQKTNTRSFSFRLLPNPLPKLVRGDLRP